MVSHTECDEIGMSAAQKLAAKRAIEGLGLVPDMVLIDGNWDFVSESIGPGKTRLIVKGDATCLSISTASVLAQSHPRSSDAVGRRTLPGLQLRREQGIPVPASQDGAPGPRPVDDPSPLVGGSWTIFRGAFRVRCRPRYLRQWRIRSRSSTDRQSNSRELTSPVEARSAEQEVGDSRDSRQARVVEVAEEFIGIELHYRHAGGPSAEDIGMNRVTHVQGPFGWKPERVEGGREDARVGFRDAEHARIHDRRNTVQWPVADLTDAEVDQLAVAQFRRWLLTMATGIPASAMRWNPAMFSSSL